MFLLQSGRGLFSRASTGVGRAIGKPGHPAGPASIREPRQLGQLSDSVNRPTYVSSFLFLRRGGGWIFLIFSVNWNTLSTLYHTTIVAGVAVREYKREVVRTSAQYV